MSGLVSGTVPTRTADPAAPQPARGLPSIRWRLSRLLLWASIAWAFAVAAAVATVVHLQIDDVLDNALRESAEVLYGTLATHAAALADADGRALPAPPHVEHLVWQLVDAEGRMLLRSHQAPVARLGEPGRAGLSEAAERWRVCALVDPAGRRTLFVAQPLHGRLRSQEEAAVLTIGVTLIVGGAIAWWLRRRARDELRPLALLSSAVASYDPLHAAQPLAPVDRAELVPMRDAIVGLAERLARHVANERAVAAHAAHALRTPLAGVVAQLASAQKQSPAAAQPALQLARAAADRLRRVVGALLTLFRSGAELAWSPVELQSLLATLPAAGLRLEHHGAATVPADPDLLAAALANLLDNALRYGASVVQVTASNDDDIGVEIAVRDDGPGVGEQRLRELQDALASQNYERGTGLGLMLADLVARAHGGRLELGRPTAGFEAVLRWPPPPGGAPPRPG